MLARFARRDAVLLVRVHGAKRCVGLSNQLLKCSNSLKRHCPPSPFRASVTRSHTETNQERPWRRPGGGSFRTQNERGQGPARRLPQSQQLKGSAVAAACAIR